MLRSGSDSTSFPRKADLILIGVFLLLALAGWLAVSMLQSDGGSVTITVDNEEIGVYSLAQDQTIPIAPDGENVTNTLQISDGKADMISADCPDQICVEHNPIHKKGETIVCLPHKIVVEVTDDESDDGDVDIIAQ